MCIKLPYCSIAKAPAFLVMLNVQKPNFTVQ